MGRMEVGFPYCCRRRKLLVLGGSMRLRDGKRQGTPSELLEGPRSWAVGNHEKDGICISSLRGRGTGMVARQGERGTQFYFPGN